MRAECKNCGKEIEADEGIESGWFHLWHGGTFCHPGSMETVAEPESEEES